MAGWPIALHGSDVQKSSFVLASLFVIVTCLKLLLVIITSVLCVEGGAENKKMDVIGRSISKRQHFPLLNLILASKVCFMLSKSLWPSSFNSW